MSTPQILAWCVPLAICLMTLIFYLKRDSLTHWEFSLGIFKGIHFSADFAPPIQPGAREKIQLPKQPVIADKLLQKTEEEKKAPPENAEESVKNLH